MPKFNPKREHLDLPGKSEGTWDYLTIYDKDNKPLVHSEAHHPESVIRVLYDGVEYVSLPGGEILLTWESLKKRLKL